jgi:hypothetical protein
MPLKAPEIHAFTGETAGQLNELAVAVLNLVNFTNHLERKLEACSNCAAKPATAARKAAPKAE